MSVQNGESGMRSLHVFVTPFPHHLDFFFFLFQVKRDCPSLLPEFEPGDTMFFHSNVLHRSGVNNSERKRRVLAIAYNRKTNDPVTPHHHPNYTPLHKVCTMLGGHRESWVESFMFQKWQNLNEMDLSSFFLALEFEHEPVLLLDEPFLLSSLSQELYIVLIASQSHCQTSIKPSVEGKDKHNLPMEFFWFLPSLGDHPISASSHDLPEYIGTATFNPPIPGQN